MAARIDLGDFDVVVVGSGSAGSSAAIAASRSGARTLIIDRLPFIGGTSTGVLDTFYGFYTPGEVSRKIVGGIPDDVIAGLKKLGPVVERANTYGAGTGVTYNPEHLKVVWERLLIDAGVKVLLHSLLQEVTVSDGRVISLTLATRSGLATVSGKNFIDASGDADLTYFANFAYERAGEISPAQTMTTTFRMVNVDVKKRKSFTKDQLHAAMEQAVSDGYQLPRREGSDHITTVDNTMATVMTRVDSVRAKANNEIESVLDNPFFLSESEINGREQALEYARFLIDRVPGYENSSLYGLSTFLGIRESRRVYGDYRVTRDDVLNAQQFDDQIALCGAPIEDHHSGTGTNWAYIPNSGVVGIPLRALQVKDSINTLVVGRCFSATHDAHASIRSMAQCMAMGTAAGTVAAIATQNSKEIRGIDFNEIKNVLKTGGAIIEMPN
ncbi:MAG: FAD-dependent oxidoreductase [Actinobacteria bacterium]|uniref:Unannotated protein n=1 Tax=freshwater metagenome TaxID=449393 RepID=A0A6J6RNA5_9ZZZZ|nr:FAD-dependent oxidoreductase [Actinomycetota bacterium]MSX71440.1 FAD-dependent oxidoreductase [Actinomycetota bacterium]MSY69308.1 FAD-dependent oxidoreductase [Actinomycetota bacterium]MTA75311.1 FAD-dependent oxidoreductase [Actinomycetota bacterium]